MGDMPVLSMLYESIARKGVRKTSVMHEGFLTEAVLPLFVGWGQTPPIDEIVAVPEFLGSRYSTYVGITESGIPFYLDVFKLVNPIVAVLGKPGSGKSEFVKSYLYRFSQNNPDVPIMIVDYEGEYEAMVESLNGVVAHIGTDAYINIFDTPMPTINPYTWARDIVMKTLMKALNISPEKHTMQVPVLEKAVINVLRDAGIKEIDRSTWTKPKPTLLDLYNSVRQILETTESNSERDSARALLKKLEAVTGPGKNYFSFQSTYKLSEIGRYRILNIVTKNVPEQGRDLITYYIVEYFNKLMDYTKEKGGSRISVVLAIDEAWIIFKRSKNEASVIEKLIRRMRKYGIMIIASTQRLEEVKDTMLPHASALFVGLMTDKKEIEYIAKSKNLPKRFVNMLPSLGRGKMIVMLDWVNKSSMRHAGVPLLVYVETAMRRFKRVSYRIPGIEDVNITDFGKAVEENLVDFSSMLTSMK